VFKRRGAVVHSGGKATDVFLDLRNMMFLILILMMMMMMRLLLLMMMMMLMLMIL